MKVKILLLLLVSVVFFVFIQSCSNDDSSQETSTPVQCNSQVDCARSYYCDLDNPQQDSELGTLVYYCKKRQVCSSQSDCPMNWKCMLSEHFCITDKEAETTLCKSDSDCRNEAYPKCNLSTGECESLGGETGDNEQEIPDISTDDENFDDSDNVPDDESGDEDNHGGNTTTDEDIPMGLTMLSEDFESGTDKWVIVSTNEETPCWEIGTPTVGPEAAHSGEIVAASRLSENYLDNCKDMLYYDKEFSISNFGKPVLSFYAWVDLEGKGYAPYDYAEVIIKKSGEVWETINEGLYLSAETPSVLDALDNSRTKITKTLGTSYYKFSGDLSAYKGETIQFGFRFVSDDSNNATGIFIDDVELSY